MVLSWLLQSLWNFILFLPIFVALLILGLLKGLIMFPVILVIITVGISVIIVALYPVHFLYTYYCVLSTKKFGWGLKLVLFICITFLVIPWLPIGIICAVLTGALYGFLAPIFATFQAIEEGKTNKFLHSIFDGIWGTLKGSFIIIRDFFDVWYYSYFSIMDDLRREPAEGEFYEIRLLYIPPAIIVGILGVLVDFPLITIIALLKSPYMLIKGWHRLFHDCIGREGPFLETICVPFAGLAIMLWPFAVIGGVLGSMVASIFLGAYAAVILYQESSFSCGLRYIVASVSIYDEYINDILYMPEGSCFPRPHYRKKPKVPPPSRTVSSVSISRANSFRKSPMVELKPLELANALFDECRFHGETVVSEGLVTLKDIEEAKKDKAGSGVITVGFPAYCILQLLLRSSKANSSGILLSDNVSELTTSNRPSDTFFQWFLNPLLIIKDQIKAANLSEEEEQYLEKLVLLSGDSLRLKKSILGPAPESEIRQAELSAIARRLRGITKSISRYPTYRRRFDSSLKFILEDISRKNGESPPGLRKSRSMFGRDRDVEIG